MDLLASNTFAAIGWIILGLGFVLGAATFWIGSRAGWHWGAALGAAAIPVVFTFFLGSLGLIIGFAFVVAVWKAN